MDRAVTGQEVTAGTRSSRTAQGMFTVSMVVSGIRCLLTYVIFPFATPFLGLAPGVGPGLGVVIGVLAIAANVWSVRRFWAVGHRLRRPITMVHVAVIAFLLALVGLDVRDLISQI